MSAPTGARSGRRDVPGLISPHPIGAGLPSLFLEDDLAQRMCAALDEVLAPVLATLDCLPAYLHPALSPPDVLTWLAGWVGLPDTALWPQERRRLLVARAAELHAWRGTAFAVRELVELATGITPQLDDPGSTTWSAEAGARPPRTGPDELVVHVIVPAGQNAPDAALLSRLVALVAPAHLAWRVEVTLIA